MVRGVSLNHQVVGSKQPLRRFCGKKACLGLSLPQTPLMWEPPALDLHFLSILIYSQQIKAKISTFFFIMHWYVLKTFVMHGVTYVVDATAGEHACCMHASTWCIEKCN